MLPNLARAVYFLIVSNIVIYNKIKVSYYYIHITYQLSNAHPAPIIQNDTPS